MNVSDLDFIRKEVLNGVNKWKMFEPMEELKQRIGNGIYASRQKGFNEAFFKSATEKFCSRYYKKFGKVCIGLCLCLCLYYVYIVLSALISVFLFVLNMLYMPFAEFRGRKY